MKKADRLKGGVAVLFGEAPQVQSVEETEVDVTKEEEAADLIDTLQDEELQKALRERQLAGRGRPKRGRPHDSRTEGYTTICVKANIDKWRKLEYISIQETLQKKEVLELALDMLIAKYEAEKGVIKLRTQSKKNNVFNK